MKLFIEGVVPVIHANGSSGGDFTRAFNIVKCWPLANSPEPRHQKWPTIAGARFLIAEPHDYSGVSLTTGQLSQVQTHSNEEDAWVQLGGWLMSNGFLELTSSFGYDVMFREDRLNKDADNLVRLGYITINKGGVYDGHGSCSHKPTRTKALHAYSAPEYSGVSRAGHVGNYNEVACCIGAVLKNAFSTEKEYGKPWYFTRYGSRISEVEYHGTGLVYDHKFIIDRLQREVLKK